jgi:hypothetical protein
MRRPILAVAALLLSAVPAFAVTRTVMVVDDVIRMSKAGVTDENIIAFVKKSSEPFEIAGDDVIAMTEAHVSEGVIKAVIDESEVRMSDERRRSERDVREAKSDERRTTVYVTPGVYSRWYDPFWYGGYYDPFWYGPRVHIGFTFGHFRGGHFRHH